MAQGVSWRAAPHSAVTTALPLGRATLILELLLIKELTTQFRHSKNAAAAPKQKGGRAGPARQRSRRARQETDAWVRASQLMQMWKRWNLTWKRRGEGGSLGVHKVVFWQPRVPHGPCVCPKPTCTNNNEYVFLKNIKWKLIRKILEAIMEHVLNVW